MESPYFCAAWVLFWLFMFGFSFASSGAYQHHYMRSGGAFLFREPNAEKKCLLYLLVFLGSLLAMGLTRFLFPECKGCLEGLVPNLDGWKAAMVAVPMLFVLFFHGFFVRVLFDLIQWGKARRNVHRFLNDCSAEGCIRAIYETTSIRHYGDFELVLYDMMRDEHDLWQITKRAVSGYKDDPVYIAMNIPPEKVLQKLEQYNLVAKNGYERLPPPQPVHYLPQGGSIVHFYYQAEYVRIWG